MNLRHLRTFVAAADVGGIARGADRLNLSQPAASRQIHSLEAELGVSLFDRVGRRVRLSSMGEDLLKHSRQLLMDAESLVGRAQALRNGETGVLSIAATPQMIETVLARFLPNYQRRHRGVEVRLVEDGGARLSARLEQGEVQVALMPAGDQRFHARLLYPVHAVAVLPAKHRLGRCTVLDVADLADESLLLLRPEFGSRAWFETACSAASLRPHVLLESAAPHTLIALAAAGYGIAVLPSNALMPGDVRIVPLVQRGASIGRWSAVTWHPHRFFPHYAEQFVDEVVGYCRRAYPGSDLLRRAPPLPRPKNSHANVSTKFIALGHAAARRRKSNQLAEKT